ncbi:hypothetical protein ACQ5SO_04140 [Rhodovulum sp. DZ06]
MPPGPRAEAIDAARRLVDEGYAAATEPLVDATIAVSGALESFRALSEEARQTPLAALSGAIGEIRAAAETMDAHGADGVRAGRALRATLKTADDALTELRRVARTIDIVALGARVAAAPLPLGARLRAIYTREMSEAAAELSASAARVEEARAGLAAAMEEVEALAGRLGALRLIAVAPALDRALEGLRAHAEDARARDGARKTSAERALKGLSNLMSALQISDAVSQRLDHMAGLLRRAEEEDLPPAAMATAKALADGMIAVAAAEFADRRADWRDAAAVLRDTLAGEAARAA